MATGAYPRAMLVVTSDTIPGYDIIAVFGAVTGSSLQPQRGLYTMGITYVEIAAKLAANRREAIGWMIADARQSNANAIVGMKMDSVHSPGGFEHCAYGTAVWAVPTTEDAKRLYEAMTHEGRVPPLSQYDEVIRRINATID